MSTTQCLKIHSIKPLVPLLRTATCKKSVMKSMYNVPLNSVPHTIKKQLQVFPKTQFDQNPKPQQCFKESGSFLSIPRYVGLKQFGRPEYDATSIGASMQNDVQFTGTLRPYQDTAVSTYMNNLRKHNMTGQQLVLSCGLGKTVIGISIACQLRRRTAILVHKDFLASQWRERIQMFTNNATVGVVQRDKCEVDRDFVLIMIQTLISGRYSAELFQDMGLVIADESHHIAAQSFVKSMEYFPAKYRLSLTATPDRSDGLTKIVNWHLGPRTVTITRNQTCKSGVHVKMIEYTPKHCVVKRRYDGTVLLPSLVTALCEESRRNQVILEEINKLLEDKGNNILVLTDRRKHVAFFEKQIPSLCNFSGGIGQYVGVTTKKAKAERERVAENCRTIVSTYAMSSEGLDIKRLNCVVLASPKKNVEQSVGRVMRSESSEVKIIDIWDSSYTVLFHLGKARSRLYQSKGYLQTRHRINRLQGSKT